MSSGDAQSPQRKQPPPPPKPRKGAQPLSISSPSLQPARGPSVSSQYLMNDILRDTPRIKLINSLLAPTHEDDHDPPKMHQADVVFGLILTDSRLDDELSVAVINFSDTPLWLQRLSRDPCGFPKKTTLGTIWSGGAINSDQNAVDDLGQTAYIRAVIEGGLNLFYAEMLAEFETTDVNIQDLHGRTALHWACAREHVEMVKLCLSVPDCVVGLLDNDGFTAFDLSLRGGHEETSMLFYKSVIDMDDTYPQEALLRALTVTSEPAEGRPVFPGLALFDPVESRNTPLVKALIHRGVDLTARNQNGDTALHIAAAINDNVEIAEMLLEAGSDVNAVGHGGVTALHYAADEKMIRVLRGWSADVAAGENLGHSAMDIIQEIGKEDSVPVLSRVTEIAPVVDLVAEAKARREMVKRRWPNGIEATYGGGLTPLAQAVLNEDFDTLRVLLELGVDIDARSATSWTALDRAAEKGFVNVINTLLSGGAQIHFANSNQSTALHFAASGGHVEAVKALLAGGAQIDFANSNQSTALHFAASRGHVEAVKALLVGGARIDFANSNQSTALHIAAGGGHVEAVKALLAGGARIDFANSNQSTALHFAASRGHVEAVKALLVGGARIDFANSNQSTALYLAAGGGYVEAVKALLAGGAQIDFANSNQSTALHFAASRGHVEAVKALLAGGAQIDFANSNQSTALHLAAGGGYVEAVKALLAGGAQIDFANSNQSTALHFAAGGGHTGAVKALLAGGAQIDFANSNQSTALHIAAGGGNTGAVKALIIGGAQIDLEDKKKRTALQIAYSRKKFEIVQLLASHGAHITPADRLKYAARHGRWLNNTTRGTENGTLEEIPPSSPV